MRRIYINGRFLTQRTTGVQRYAREVTNAIDQLISDDRARYLSQYRFDIVLPSDSKEIPTYSNISVQIKGFSRGHLWEQMELPRYTQDGLLLNLCNMAPLFHRNQAVVVHDAAVFAHSEAYEFVFRKWYQFLLPRIIRRARTVITVSEFSQQELIEYCRTDRDNINVVYEGIDHMYAIIQDERILDRYELKEDNFILVVSSSNPQKNFPRLISALERIKEKGYSVIIAGGRRDNVFHSEELINIPGVHYAGYVSDNELKALYSAASLFVHPSLYEGFGLTPLEAMACGCPVLVSNSAALPEICGDAAMYFNPYDVEDLANQIVRIMDDANLREALEVKGAKRTKKFHWEKTARKILNLIC